MKTPLQQGFELFTGELEAFRDLSIIIERGGYAYATNLYVAIRIKKEFIDFDLSIENKDYPKIEKTDWSQSNLRPLTVDRRVIEMFMTEDETTHIGNNVDCAECNGSGEVEWTYGRHTMDADCPICDGDGLEARAKYVKTGNKTFPEDNIIQINDYKFNMRFFYKLFKLSDLLKSDILISDFSENKGKFKVGECEIIIMKTASLAKPTYTIES